MNRKLEFQPQEEEKGAGCIVIKRLKEGVVFLLEEEGELRRRLNVLKWVEHQDGELWGEVCCTVARVPQRYKDTVQKREVLGWKEDASKERG